MSYDHHSPAIARQLMHVLLSTLEGHPLLGAPISRGFLEELRAREKAGHTIELVHLLEECHRQLTPASGDKLTAAVGTLAELHTTLYQLEDQSLQVRRTIIEAVRSKLRRVMVQLSRDPLDG